MGTFIEKYIIVNVYENNYNKKYGKTENERIIDNFIKKVPIKFVDLFRKFQTIANGYNIYFMCWDGSKEGWDIMEEAKKIRQKFIDLLNSLKPKPTILFITEDYEGGYLINEI